MSNDQTVNWREWGEEAFREAQRHDKPILLAIGASWCHWCHVMDEESFTHPEVIRVLHQQFIPIRVDSDKRPDINARYNMGGWPTVAILSPQGELITGGTYSPLNQFLASLKGFAQCYREERGAVEETIARIAEKRKALFHLSPGAREADAAVVDEVGRFLVEAYDSDYGGFGGPPKFPMPDAITLALLLHARTKEETWLTMVSTTLDSMLSGEIHDVAEGGFFRYATSSDWNAPHYEKLLEANAFLAKNYLQAYLWTGEHRYEGAARGIFEYVLSTLIDGDERWFYGSQDADQDYYRLNEEERLNEEPPSVDTTLYSGWNAAMVSSAILASSLLEKESYRETALRVINSLWDRCVDPEKGVAHYHDGSVHLFGLLDDQVLMSQALLDACEATGERHYMDRAEALLILLLKHLWDSETGMVLDIPAQDTAKDTAQDTANEEPFGILRERDTPLKDNAEAAQLLIRLSWLTGKKVYQERARTILRAFSETYHRYKVQAAPYAIAVDMLLRPPLFVTIVGPQNDPRTRALREAALRLKEPWKAVLTLDPERDQERLAERRYPTADRPVAYLCVDTACLPPVTRPEEMAGAAERLSSPP